MERRLRKRAENAWRPAQLSRTPRLISLTHDLLQAASYAARAFAQAGGTAAFSPAASCDGVGGGAPSFSAHATHASLAAQHAERFDLRTEASTAGAGAEDRPRPRTMQRRRAFLFWQAGTRQAEKRRVTSEQASERESTRLFPRVGSALSSLSPCPARRCPHPAPRCARRSPTSPVPPPRSRSPGRRCACAQLPLSRRAPSARRRSARPAPVASSGVCLPPRPPSGPAWRPKQVREVSGRRIEWN